jgi:cardiolipin synthase
LQAIRQAQRSVHVEAFIFHKEGIGLQFRDALVERAKAGVRVRVVVDAAGSLTTPDRFFQPIRDAGGCVEWYQPILRLTSLKRLNNRTHRELIVIDGETGFLGGAGIGTYWETGDKRSPAWRDMMFRVDGGLAGALQTAFSENWLESSGDVLACADDFPPARDGEGDDPATDTVAFVVISSPTFGRSTRARTLFQTLIAAASRSIHIHSPYFLPDRSATEELVSAVKERGVSVQVIVPGKANDHRTARLASRRRYGPLLKAGVEIYEYQPGMIHTKTMTVDGRWAVVGSTNFDSRSFDLNDEINLVARDVAFAERIEREFQADLAQSKQITYEDWQCRSLLERIAAQLGRIIERQE